MNERRRPIALLATVALLLVACGGGGATTTAPGGDGATPGPTQATTAATPGPVSGGTAAGVCELVTGDELAGIFGVPSVTTTVFVGPPDTCSVESDTGVALTAWSYTTGNAAGSTFDLFALPSQSVEVPGIGDRAAFVENTGLLVLKGDALVVIGLMSGAGDLSQDEMNSLMKQIGALAAGRM